MFASEQAKAHTNTDITHGTYMLRVRMRTQSEVRNHLLVGKLIALCDLHRAIQHEHIAIRRTV